MSHRQTPGGHAPAHQGTLPYCNAPIYFPSLQFTVLLYFTSHSRGIILDELTARLIQMLYYVIVSDTLIHL